MLHLEYTPYIWPFLVSLLVTVALGIYAIRRRHVPTASLFAWMMVALAYWTFCYTMELLSTTAEDKIFWAAAKYPGAAGGPVLLFAFSLEATKHGHWLNNRALRVVLWLFVIATCLIVFTNPYHHWYWTTIGMVPGEPETVAGHGFYFWVYAIAAYVMVLISVVLYFRYYRSTPRLYRQQAAFLALGGFIPLGGRILEDFFGIDLFPKIDNIILLLLLSGIFFTLAIFRYGALNILHIAHNLVIQNINAGIIVLDMQARLIELNPYAQAIVGVSAAEVIGKPIETTMAYVADLTQSDYEVTLPRGEAQAYYSVQVSTIKEDSGELAGYAIVLFDITARKQAERQLERLARTDPLTHVMNRRYFFELASTEFVRAWRHERPVTILMFDIDHFKQVNDTYGHQIGDEVLKLVASKCQWEVRASDLLARIGGEEFICMLTDSNQEGALATAERIRSVIEATRPEFDGRVVPVTISVGLAHAVAVENMTLESLITRADQALYAAKADGRNCVRVWAS